MVAHKPWKITQTKEDQIRFNKGLQALNTTVSRGIYALYLLLLSRLLPRFVRQRVIACSMVTQII